MRDVRTRTRGFAALTVLTLVTAALVVPGTTPAFGAGVTTTRVSVDSSGAQAGGPSDANGDGDIDEDWVQEPSTEPAMSADGRFVAFPSLAANLVAGDTNGASDVFVHDRQTGATTRVSVDSSGAQGNGPSLQPAISADGRFVAFTSSAPNLVANDTNDQADVFVHDRQTGATTRVSVDSTGAESFGYNASNSGSAQPAISADGRYVTFSSRQYNLVPGDTNQTIDVFVHDRQTGATSRVSLTNGGAQLDSFGSSTPSISADGRFVAFQSGSPDIIAGDTNENNDVFVRDRQTGATTRVSVDSTGGQAFGATVSSAISADGRYVAFASVLESTGIRDAWVHDRQTGVTSRVSVDSAGVSGNFGANAVAISADGRFVVFTSAATNLVAGDTNGAFDDVFVRDRQTGTTTRVSLSSAGAQTDAASSQPAISGDGSVVAYTSSATNLVAGDTNDTQDVFVSTINPPVDASPPVITPQVTGTIGSSGWYTSSVGVSWNVADPESTVTSTTGCGAANVTVDTAGQTLTCSATSAGGTASQSVTVKRDATRPTVTVGGAGTYPLTANVAITCSPTDATSGVASNTCAAIAGTKPAWQYAAGNNARSASATDRAGNSQSATANVVVAVSASGLCTLTKTFVQGSAKFQALSAVAKTVTNALLTAVCNDLDRLVGRLTAAQKASVIAAYKTAVGSLISAGWVTADQGAALRRWADAV